MLSGAEPSVRIAAKGQSAQSAQIVEKRTFAAAKPLLPLPPLAHDALDDGAPRGGCDDCNQLAMV
jgi:hypothetical protein